MKRKKSLLAMVFLLVAVLLFTASCYHTPDSSLAPASSSEPVAHSASSPFFVLEEWTEEEELASIDIIYHHKIVVDATTRVMYHQSLSTGIINGKPGLGSTFSVLLNADGTPRLYEGLIPTSQ